MLKNHAATLTAASLLFACHSDLDLFGTSTQAAAPAGSNAAPVTHNVPLVMSPGERLNVRVVMQNTGALLDGSNDWDNTYSLRRTNNLWSWVSTRVPAPPNVTPGQNATFDFVITAPTTPGPHTFGGRMAIVGDNPPFGNALNVPGIVVDPGVQRRWSCAEGAGSVINTAMTPGESQMATAVIQNTGTETWNPPGFCLRSMESPVSFWGGNTCVTLNAPVPPGGTASFTFRVTAPLAEGTYTLSRQMLDGNPTSPAGGVGLFDLNPANGCFVRTITVTGAQQLNAELVGHDFPTSLVADSPFTVTVQMRNNGTETWLADGNYVLYSLNSPASLWGAVQGTVTETPPGAVGTITLNLTAPLQGGPYAHQWRMRKLTGPNAGFFGDSIDVAVTVDPIPEYDSSIVAQVIPPRVTAGLPTQFRITLRNSGTASWSGGTSQGAVALGTRNSPSALWGTTISYIPLGTTIARNETFEFVLNVTAPTTPGTYTSRWQARQIQGVSWFGPIATTANIVVTLCGNGVIDPGEQCDDGNLISGDGCSDMCTTDVAPIDLAVTPADRTFFGSVENKGLSTVASGAIFGGTTPALLMAEISHVTPDGAPFRNQAGKVFAYTGGGPLFSGVQARVPNGAALEIWGARANDRLGAAVDGGLAAGDVTGDGIADVIASAPDGEGFDAPRTSCGAVYVLTGGAGLAGADVVDLAEGIANPRVRAVIIGPSAGDRLRVIAAGADLTGDGVGDLLLGAPGANGGDGVVYVVAGGAALTGEIDLAAPGALIVHTILSAGPGAGDALGRAGAVGNVGGSAAADILLGSQLHDPFLRNNAGGAWAIFGPITDDVDLGQPAGSVGGPSVVWVGAGPNTRIGSSVAIGNVDGPAAVIGAVQFRNGGGTQVGAVDVWVSPAAGVLFDLALDTPPTPRARIRGRDANDNLGTAVALGDLDGDGFMDIAVSASSGDGPLNDRDGAGELVLIRGGPAMAAFTDLAVTLPAGIIYGAGARDLLGHHPGSITLGDFDGDGRADHCVGSFRGGDGLLAAPGRIDCFRSTF